MMPAHAPISLLNRVQDAWRRCGIAVTAKPGEDGRIQATVERGQRQAAFDAALGALQSCGCSVCADRSCATWSVFGFSEDGCVCIDLSSSGGARRPPRRRFPVVALLGPDGVGKSTALRLVREWFARNAPFIDIAVRQWRPGLLPPLAALLGKGGKGEGESDFRPRRERGNLQWIRLPYYFLDFVFGSWWKDRGRNRSRLVIYDRCALDMAVDPYRFGLASAAGTRALWRWTPRPDLLTLLYDSPARIAARKDDLQEHEVAEQLERWLQFASEDQVQSIVQVDAGPEQIAARVRSLFIEAFISAHEHGFGVQDDDAVDRFANMFGDAAETDQYAALPSRANARFLIPLKDRAAAAASLAVYNAQRPIARAAKNIVTAGLRLGVAQPFLRDRVSLPREPLPELLARAVGEDHISIAASLGTPGPNRKPALQIMDAHGRILAYAKIGGNAATIASVRNEARALEFLQNARFSGADIPRVLFAGECRGNYVLVQSAAEGLRAAGLEAANSHVHFLAELYEMACAVAPLPRPDEQAIAACAQAGFHYYAHQLAWARRFCAGYDGVPFGPAHRDFTPWNIRTRRERLFIYDWETFDARIPAAWDLFHLIVAGGVEVRGASPAAIYGAITEPGRTRDLISEYFRRIGAETELVEPLFIAYAADALCSSVLHLGDAASTKDVQMRRAWAGLLMLARYCGKPSRATASEAVPELV